MKVTTGAEMRNIDKTAIEKYGIPGIVLMENAGRCVFDICENYISKSGKSNVLIVAGKGNNGGDGFVVARLLKNKGYSVSLIVVSEKSDIKGDALTNIEIAEKIGIDIKTYKPEIFEKEIFKCDFIVDALLGTGLKGEVREPYKTVIESINKSEKYVISVDIPSGLDSDTGEILGSCVVADETVTLALPKRGLYLENSFLYTGKLTVADISMPSIIYENDMDIKGNVLTKEEAFEIMPKRIKRSNKGTYGRLFVVAGSKGMTGASYLCCKSAYRTGCGVVHSCIVNSAVSVMQSILPEAVYIPLEDMGGFVYKDSIDDVEHEMYKALAFVIGPGLGGRKQVSEFVKQILVDIDVTAVIDADGLNAIADDTDILKKMKKMPIITPHPKEMERLTGIPVKDILNNTVDVALDFAKTHNCVVLLKDSRTVIANPKGEFYINTRGSSALAKGGSGDVLSGIIGSLVSQGCDTFESAVLGAYIHGITGEIAGERFTNYGSLSGDFADIIPEALKSILE